MAVKKKKHQEDFDVENQLTLDSSPSVVEVVTGEIVETPQEIHQRICNNFDVVEKTLYEICLDLKTIRDNKYYKQLGYETFESYCLECFNISRYQGYRYIAIAEKFNIENVAPVQHLGVRKLYCLSQLTEEERTELMESTDVENATAKEVEQKAKEIKDSDGKSSALKLNNSMDYETRRVLDFLESKKDTGEKKPKRDVQSNIEIYRQVQAGLFEIINEIIPTTDSSFDALNDNIVLDHEQQNTILECFHAINLLLIRLDCPSLFAGTFDQFDVLLQFKDLLMGDCDDD